MKTRNYYFVEGVDFVYPKQYEKPKPIFEQIRAIEVFFGLDGSNAVGFVQNLPELPNGAEGWFAIPKVSAVAKKHFPDTYSVEQYCEAVKMVLRKIAVGRKFRNDREGQITSSQIIQHPRTLSFLKMLEVEQGGDILIIAAQHGMFYKGESVNKVCTNFSSNEFGLGAFQVGCMALTHPERYAYWEELGSNCPGDKFLHAVYSTFSEVPVWKFNQDELVFSTWNIFSDLTFFGSVSAFLHKGNK